MMNTASSGSLSHLLPREKERWFQNEIVGKFFIFFLFLPIISFSQNKSSVTGISPPLQGERGPGGEASRTIAILDLTTKNAETTDAEIYSVQHVLKVAGLSFITTADVNTAITYPIVIASSKLGSATFTIAEQDSLISFVNKGGILIAPTIFASSLHPLFGISGNTEATTRHRINFNTSLPNPAFRWLEDTLERNISLGSFNYPNVVSSNSFSTTTAVGLATYDDNSTAITQNNYGLGKAYTLGVSFKNMILIPQLNKDFEAQRTYSNGFEPTSDAWILFLKGICIGQIPNSVWLHTSPYDSKASLIVTHDIDATTSYDTMHYYADFENSIGLSATYFVTTHYLEDGVLSAFYNSASIPKVDYLLDKGHKLASHSVGHFHDFDDESHVPYGALGNTTSNYAPYNGGLGQTTTGATVLGETELSKHLLEADLGVNIRSFRAGYLCYHNKLVSALDTLGYTFNSTYSAGDVLTNFPYKNRKDRVSSGAPSSVWEIPMTISDVFNSNLMSPENYLEKQATWIDVVERNTRNYAPTVLLVHPTRYYKLFAEQGLISLLPSDVTTFDIETYGDYWLNRNSVTFTSKLQNDTLTVVIPHTLLPIDTKISFIVDDGQSLSFIKAEDDLGNPIAVIQSLWETNSVIIHFGNYTPLSIAEHSFSKENSVIFTCNPNPVSNTARVEVWQKTSGRLTIQLFDMMGKLVKTITNEGRHPGIYRETFDAANLASGTYFCKVSVDGESKVKKVIMDGGGR